MNQMTEWRKIPGFENYEASECGQIRRATSGPGTHVGRVLRQKRASKAYWYFRVSLSHNGINSDHSVHRLVAYAFLGPAPTEFHEVAHNDNNPHNNHYSNLRWATRIENMDDKIRHGTLVDGDLCWNARLTAVDFERMQDLSAAGISATKIGAYLGFSQTYVSSLLRGKYRRDLRI
jgi:hypothetical protein